MPLPTSPEEEAIEAPPLPFEDSKIIRVFKNDDQGYIGEREDMKSDFSKQHRSLPNGEENENGAVSFISGIYSLVI